MDSLLYGQPVLVINGFYKGQAGTIEAVGMLEEQHIEYDRPSYGYQIRLANGYTTDFVHEYHIKIQAIPKPKENPKAKLLKLTKPPKPKE